LTFAPGSIVAEFISRYPGKHDSVAFRKAVTEGRELRSQRLRHVYYQFQQELSLYNLCYLKMFVEPMLKEQFGLTLLLDRSSNTDPVPYPAKNAILMGGMTHDNSALWRYPKSYKDVPFYPIRTVGETRDTIYVQGFYTPKGVLVRRTFEFNRPHQQYEWGARSNWIGKGTILARTGDSL
jgi:hypothetical protein